MTVEVDEQAPIPHSINWRGIGAKAWPVIQLMFCAIVFAIWMYVGIAGSRHFD